MKLRLFGAAVAAVAAAVAASAVYVGAAVRRDLGAVEAAVSTGAATLTEAQAARIRSHVDAALARLDSAPARLLALVPIARQNVAAARAAATAAGALVTRGLDVAEQVAVIERGGLIADGAIRIDAVSSLHAPLARLTAALEGAERRLRHHLGGWLLPPVWRALEETVTRVDELHDRSAAVTELVAAAPALLGAERPRTYLVVLLNNAELRGAGGIPSAVGTVTAATGALELGRFVHAVELRGRRPYDTVPAPPDFARRFARYGADTTFWVNTTFSPDVPDVALVASRLYAVATGVRTDGVLFVDPRGIAALLPEGAELPIRGGDRTVGRDDLPGYVYSRAYEEIADQDVRREVLLDLGTAAFPIVLRSGLRDRAALDAAGAAVAAGHIRFVPFDPVERSALDRLHASGDLAPVPTDGLVVTTNNFGGDKLDFWARRRITHACEVTAAAARCTTAVEVENAVPPGLTRYVANRPYGVMRSLLEVYVPGAAHLTRVDLDGRPARFYREPQDGHAAVGLMTRIAPGVTRRVTIAYRLPLDDNGYSLVVRPQPLAADARLTLRIETPPGWTVAGPGADRDGVGYTGDLTGTVVVTARPGATGLTALWEGLVRFWREPLF